MSVTANASDIHHALCTDSSTIPSTTHWSDDGSRSSVLSPQFSVLSQGRHDAPRPQVAHQARPEPQRTLNISLAESTLAHRKHLPDDADVEELAAREAPPAGVEKLAVGGVLQAAAGVEDQQSRVLARVRKGRVLARAEVVATGSGAVARQRRGVGRVVCVLGGGEGRAGRQGWVGLDGAEAAERGGEVGVRGVEVDCCCRCEMQLAAALC